MSNFAFRKSWAVHILFYAFFNRTSGDLLSETNGNITLKTDISHQKIHEILWIFKGNKVVDWDLNAGLTEYLQFKGRTSLVQTTGDLTIFNLKSEDSGRYEAEVIIDGNIKSAVRNLKVIDPVSDLSITCISDNGQSATLHCQAEGADLTYSWSGPGLNKGMNGQIGPNITKEDNTDSVYNCVVGNLLGNKTKNFRAADCFKGETGANTIALIIPILAIVLVVGFLGYCVWRKKCVRKNSEVKINETEDPLLINGHGEKVLQTENAQVDQSEDVEETHEREEREAEKLPLTPPNWSATKTFQVQMRESNDGETERDQAGGSLRAHQGESSTWKDVEKGAPPHERGEKETEIVPSTPPKVPPPLPRKPSKRSEVQFSDSAGDTDTGREERERDGDQGESNVSKEVDNEGENESRGKGETDTSLSPMSSPPNQPNRPPVPPKPKNLSLAGPLDSSSLNSDLNKGLGTNITCLETLDSLSMAPSSDDTDQPQPDRSESGNPV